MAAERTELMAQALMNYALDPQPGTIVSGLDVHQRAVLQSVANSWGQGNKDGFVASPTGTGKGRMLAAIAEGTRLVEPERQNLIVVPKQQHIDQTEAEILGLIPDARITKYFADEKDPTGNFLITTYVSLVLGVARGHIRPDAIKLLLLDEGHHGLSNKRRQVIQDFGNTPTVGLTATPGFGKNRHLRDILPAEISRTSIREAVEANRISSFSVLMVKTGIDIGDVKVKGQGGNRDFDPGALQKAINLAARNQAAVDLYEQAFSDKKSMAFCAGIEHGRALADQFRSRGIRAEAVWGDQPKKVKDDIIAKYRSGEIQALCNADLLIEGFDDVKTSVILNLRPTLSPRLAEQRGGRALRLDRGDPSKMAYIVDFIDEVEGANNPISFAQVAEAAQIVNTWYEHKGTGKAGYVKPVILDLKGAQVITNKKDVMWAVNELSGSDFEVEPGWKTLRRISAETGIRMKVLGGLADEVWIDERQKALVRKEFESPRGNLVEHFSDIGALGLVNWALAIKGYREYVTSSSRLLSAGEAYARELDYIYNFPELIKYKREIANVDPQWLLKYGYDLYKSIMDSGRLDELMESTARVSDALVPDFENLKAELWAGPEVGPRPGWDRESWRPREPYRLRMPQSLEHAEQDFVKSNGELILFPTKLADGTELALQVRYFDIPESGVDENVDFSRDWTKEERRQFGVGRILVVDAYSYRHDPDPEVKMWSSFGKKDKALVPIGHLDWSELTFDKKVGVASGRANLHRNIVARTDYEYDANIRWGWNRDNEVFSSRVSQEYKRQGTGTLMLVASMLALKARGFTHFDPGAVTQTERLVYRKFGILDSEFGKSGVEIEKILKKPLAKIAIKRFMK